MVLALRNIDNDPKKSDIVYASNKNISEFVCFSFVWICQISTTFYDNENAKVIEVIERLLGLNLIYL